MSSISDSSISSTGGGISSTFIDTVSSTISSTAAAIFSSSSSSSSSSANNIPTLAPTIPPLYRSDLCHDFRCDTLPASIIAGVVLVSIPLILSTILSYYLLKRASFKLSRLNGIVSSFKWSILTETDFSFKERSSYITVLIHFLVYLPIGGLILFSVLVWYLLLPYYINDKYPIMICISILCGGFIVLFSIINYYNWSANAYRLTRFNTICMLLILLSLIIMQFALTYSILDTERSTYIILILYNLIPIELNNYLNSFIHRDLEFNELIAFTSTNIKEIFFNSQWLKQQLLFKKYMLFNFLLSILALLAYSNSALYNYNSYFGYQVAAAILFCDISIALYNYTKSNLPGGLDSIRLNLLSFLCRAILFIGWVDYWFISVSINYLIFAILLIYYIIDRHNPILTTEQALDQVIGSIESEVENIKLKAERELFKQKQLTKSASIDSDHTTHSINPIKELKHLSVNLVNNAKSLLDGSLLVNLFDSTMNRYSSIFRTPEFAFTIVTIIYSIYILIALYADVANPVWGSTAFPAIKFSTESISHPQYEYGLLSLLLVISGSLLFYSYRIFEINLFQFKLRVIITAIIYIIVSTGSGILLSFRTNSNYIFIISLYCPALSITAIGTYTQWRSADYYWNSYIVDIRRDWDQWNKSYQKQLKLTGESTQLQSDDTEPIDIESTNQWTATNTIAEQTNNNSSSSGLKTPTEMGERPSFNLQWQFKAAIAFFKFQHSIRDYMILILVLASYGLVLAIGGHFSTYLLPGSGWVIAELIALFLITIFFILKYFNTFDIGLPNLAIMIVLLIHTCTALHDSTNLDILYSIGLGCLHPAICGFILSGYTWRSSNWSISTKQIHAMLYSSAAILAFILVAMIIKKQYLAGTIAIGAFIIAAFFITMGIIWSSNSFHLPAKWAKLSIVALSILCIGAIIAIIVLKLYWFWIFTFILSLIFICLLFSTIEQLSESDSKKYQTSKYIFPVYSYQPTMTGQLNIQLSNRGMIGLIAISVLLMLWGLMAGLLIEPQYVGWIIFAIGTIVLIESALSASFNPVKSFWTAFQIALQSPALIEEARKMAIDSELRQDENENENESEVILTADTDIGLESTDRATNPSIAAAIDNNDYLNDLRSFWRWESRTDLVALTSLRASLLKYQWLPDYKDYKQIDRARRTELNLSYLDTAINRAYSQQSRILVTFQLLLLASAASIQKKNSARIKDFIRLNRGTDKNQFPDFNSMNSLQILQWAAIDSNKLLIAEAKSGYLDYTINSFNLQQNQAEKDRLLAEQRKAAKQNNNTSNELLTPNSISISINNQSSPAAATAAVVVPVSKDNAIIAAAAATAVNPSTTTENNKPDTVTAPISPVVIPKEEKSFNPLIKPADPSIVSDRYRYTKRKTIAFDVNQLDIRGATAAEVQLAARKAVNAIIAAHQSTDHSFCDPSFPIVSDLDALIEDGINPDDKDPNSPIVKPGQGAIWSRPSEFIDSHTGPQLFIDSELNPKSIIQGDLEDCYLLSALSVLAKSKSALLKSAFLVGEYNQYGIYGMTFYSDGEWKAIFIDDQFPTRINPKTNKRQLVFARSINPNEFWVSVCEKCYAKLYSGYQSIIGGLVHESLKDLTGGQSDEISLDTDTAGIYDGRLWNRLYTYYQSGYLMGCGNPKPSNGNFTVHSGIVQGHAYAILELREADNIRLIKCRNPWGDTEWTGDWSDNSNKWTQKYRKLFDQSEDNTSSDDGIFWISIEDFAVQFQRVYICRLFEPNQIIQLNKTIEWAINKKGNTVNNIPTMITDINNNIPKLSNPTINNNSNNIWYNYQIHSEWRGITAAGCPLFIKDGGNPQNNPQYQFTLLKSTKPEITFITLTQKTQLNKLNYLHMALLILNKSNQRARSIKKSELLGGEMKFKNNREISIEFTAVPNTNYTIFPSTYKSGQEGEFTITIYSRAPFLLRPFTDTEPFY